MPDNDQIIEKLSAEAKKAGALWSDIILINNNSYSISMRMDRPEDLESSESSAVGLRVFADQGGGVIGQANVSSTDFDDSTLQELAAAAVSMARAPPADSDSTLAPSGLYPDKIQKLDLLDKNQPNTDWLLARCAEAEQSALAEKGITNSEGADASYSRSKVLLAVNGEGSQHFRGEYETSHFSVSVSVLAGSGTEMERDYDFTSARHRSDLKDANEIGKSAASFALARLNPRKVASCEVPIIFDPRVSKSLVSTLCGAISGSAVSRGSSFLKNSMGKKVFADGVYIFDDPHIKRGFASRPFDMEGVANKKQHLIKDGVLETWLLDMRTANKLGLTTTGNAARGIGSPPSPSATNAYMQAGKLSPEELMKDIRNGLYLTETFGMGVNTVTGDYSQGAAGFWIENGEIAYPVSEITIAGNLRDMFLQITPANDLEFRYSTNAPTIRIEKMTVAGT